MRFYGMRSSKERPNLVLDYALALIALGTGGMKPCVSSLGDHQFDDGDHKEVLMKPLFFKCSFFAVNVGAILGITLLVYAQQVAAFRWGFGLSAGAAICSILILVGGSPYYRFKSPKGSPFLRFLQVVVASTWNNLNGVHLTNDETPLYEVQTTESDIVSSTKLPHTPQYRFFDKAAVMVNAEDKSNRWRICTVTQVEEFKTFIRVLPVWASTIALSLSYAQLLTFFLGQANVMDRTLGDSFKIPTGSVPVFSAITLILLPIYEKLIVPFLRNLTGHHRGITSLQGIGVGLFVSVFATASAALVEMKRRNYPLEPYSMMSVFWLLPQFLLMGTAEVFTYVGQWEFFYDEATDGTRSTISAMCLCEIGIGSWLSTALVKIIEAASGGQYKGWLRDNLNERRLDYFYWVLTAINGVNFLVYLVVAHSFRGKGAHVMDEAMAEFTNPQYSQP
ncbi:protein NRT1/ PTR FAMILY 8.2 [Vigna angularis]|nr:protein NRT1/ PTR FAMILY 8.2 [Vigna angularis]